LATLFFLILNYRIICTIGVLDIYVLIIDPNYYSLFIEFITPSRPFLLLIQEFQLEKEKEKNTKKNKT